MDGKTSFIETPMNAQPSLITVKVVNVLSPAKVTVVLEDLVLRGRDMLEMLESNIASEWNDSFCKESVKLTSSMSIAVRDGTDGRCKRGLVTAVTGNHAEVFLCDYGTFIDIDAVNTKNWIPLSDVHQKELCCFASIVVIPGLSPGIGLTLPNTEKIIPTNNWKPAAVSAAKDWLSQAEKVAITIFKRDSPTLIYGDFYKKGSKISLSEYMTTTKMALIDSKKFTNLVLAGDAEPPCRP